MSWTESAIVGSEILTLFVNTLTTDDKYSRRNMKKQKTFSGFFLAFLKCALNLKHFEKKDEYSIPVIYKVIDSERGVLLKRLKGLISEHHSVVNVLTGCKNC